ncbi:Eco57I restriction-modification methylase domain-containing protein [Methanobrevibacter sp.]|uniref:Eco57I restriction-modification methylase domain-containing protein n=1 Tax=Methanobrevibacter sp. TaxID=66852 RepID=UPI00388DECA6
MSNFKSSKEEIEKLVKEFKENEHIYKTATFDEENTKINFINKFFIALGWDVYNDLGVAPQYKDVEFEDTILINGKPKAPDYCFRIGGVRKFFVEAKKPSVDIENDRKYAFQLKRYTWSGKLPVGLLTDFEELAIYEPKSAPKKTHNTSVDRIKYYHYSEYVEKWDEIYNIFSKEAILTGKFDKFVENKHGDKKGTSTVDSEFLKTIEKWRLELARNIAIRNKELTVDELNFAVQLIIDRIIFLRIAEDRGIERYGQLKKLTELAKNEKDNYPVYEAFIDLCKKADAKYNSGLFHFSEEKDISLSADTLTPGLHIDDGKLKKIIDGLYYPDCPYEFSLISTEILGNIYEQFLGKVIRLTDSHQAKVEDKPEVKKAGGVFYTPQYIVDYIVENTIGELLKDKTPNKVSKLRFVDPACGSGSFLLGAYQKLLDWHLDYYSNLEQPPKNVIYIGSDGIPRLTIQEKKRILLNNIYGVDIDSQAVEVTKLSLLLKVLEDENKDVLEAQQKLIQERALPYLGDNIKCGNSLIGTDILDSNELSIEELHEINPFDWEDGFSEVFENGGFDAVIGNPPYVNAKILTEIMPIQRTFLSNCNNYSTLYQKWDLYIPFMEKSLNILKNNGIMSMIIPYPFIDQNYAKVSRKYILNEHNLIKMVDLSSQKIFKNATVSNCIPIISKGKNTKDITIASISDELKINNVGKKSVDEIVANDKTFIFDLRIQEKLNKDFSSFKRIGDYCFISKGMVLNADEKKAKGKFKKADLISDTESNIHIKKYIEGKNIDRYRINKIRYLEWGTRRVPSKISRPTFKELYHSKKVLVNKLGAIKAIYDDTQIFCDQTLRILVLWDDLRKVNNRSIKSSITRYANESRENLENNSKEIDLKYILLILNSKMGQYLLNEIRGINNKDINPEYLKDIPIPKISLETQQPFIELADKMLELNKTLADCKTPKEEKLLKLQIAKTDEKIDQLVYELYELTDEEIAIIEESLK